MLTLKEATMLGDIPSDWASEPLMALLSQHYAGDWGEDRGPLMTKVVRSTNLTDHGRLNLDDIALRALSARTAALLAPREHDILLERSGGGPDQPVGRVGLVERDMPGHAFSNFLHLLRPNTRAINPRFLGWVLHRINQSGRIVRLEQQTTQMRNLNFRDYLTMRLPTPPREEQDAIAEALDAVDAAQERAELASGRARDFERAVLEEAFAELSAPRRRLREFILDVRYGTSKAASDRDWGNPVLRIPNVTGDRMSLDDLAYVELPASDVSRLKLENGDLLLVRSNGNPGYVGRSVVFRQPDHRTWVYASYLIRVRLGPGLLPEFVNVFLGLERGRRELLRRVTTSAGNHNINSNSIRLLQLPVPESQETQERIVSLATRCRAHFDALRSRAVALDVLKKTLMCELLTGRVRISDQAEGADK